MRHLAQVESYSRVSYRRMRQAIAHDVMGGGCLGGALGVPWVWYLVWIYDSELSEGPNHDISQFIQRHLLRVVHSGVLCCGSDVSSSEEGGHHEGPQTAYSQPWRLPLHQRLLRQWHLPPAPQCIPTECAT